MDTYLFVIFKFFDNRVAHGIAQVHVDFEQCNKLLAIVGEYPYAVLETMKTGLYHDTPQVIAILFSLLANVEHNDTPTSIPSLGAFGADTGGLHLEVERALSRWRNLDPLLLSLFNKANMTFCGKTR